MAQHDTVIANAVGATFRADINSALQALFSNSSGTSAPSVTVAFMFWADTTTGNLKLRNAANSDWVTVGPLATTNFGFASLAGATFTSDIVVPDEAYDATAWNGSLEVPTKNAIRDYLEGGSLNSVPVGSIMQFAGTEPPTGFLEVPVAATNINRTTYAELFAAISTTWGVGDGSTTFGMPYCPAGYTLIQGTGSEGGISTGANKAHTHTSISSTLSNANQQVGATKSTHTFNSTVYRDIGTGSSGGAANLPAGARVMYIVKY